MSEIIVGKINYLGPTAIDPRDAEIDKLQKLSNFAEQQILAFEGLLARKDAEIAALRFENGLLRDELREANRMLDKYHTV